MNKKQFKVVVLPMSWMEWNETGMLKKYFPTIDLIEGKHETHHFYDPREFEVDWEGLKELAELFDVLLDTNETFVIRERSS